MEQLNAGLRPRQNSESNSWLDGALRRASRGGRRSVSMMMVCAAMCLLHAVGVKLSVVRCSFAIAVLSFRPTYIVYVVGVVVVCSAVVLLFYIITVWKFFLLRSHFVTFDSRNLEKGCREWIWFWVSIVVGLSVHSNSHQRR